ncbi:type III-B CRISPR module RAMP protein Cmr6 [Endozoicomonas sp. ONNA2]|uniref:type III-B CRISPR module RAMP protein Cmr6 n=1 Tax=Endozoicomonas sp. ONNA2 TaxID=2828741 RepID=UPI00214867CB|nr:type III-B CRISPR module RAMP protein Cmr6 [Endozoicomonas sp. ONNA2]
MPRPLYKGAEPPKPAAGFHKGLWFERFFNYSDPTFKEVGDGDKEQAITQVSGAAGSDPEIERFASRQIKLINSLGGQFQIFSLDWHFVTGMGNEHPVENGFLWHPTLGTPYLPGSAVKGLLRSWLEQNLEPGTQRQELLHQWFGSKGKKPEEQQHENQAGDLIFHDAIPVGATRVRADIMTPHMGKWYEKGGEGSPANSPDTIPADWHNPIPVPFLVTTRASFLFAVSPRTGAMNDGIDDVMKFLGNALEELGAGAKTAAGYGSMQRDGKQEAIFAQRLQSQQEQQQQQAFEASLSPAERAMYQVRQQLEADRRNGNKNAGGDCKRQLNLMVDQAATEQWSKAELEELCQLALDILNHHGPAPKKGKGKELMQKIRRLQEQAI